MVKKSKSLKVLPVVFILLAAMLAVFRGMLLSSYIDTNTGLYSNESLGRVFLLLTAGLTVAALCTFFHVKRFAFDRPIKNESIMAAFSASVCALMMLAIFFVNIYDAFTGKRTFGVLFGAETVLCIPSVIYFFTICSKGAKQNADTPPAYSLLPIFPALYAAVRTITLFINTRQQINASQRSFVLLTLVFIMMFFITEAEFSIPLREEEKKKRAVNVLTAKYYAVGLVVVVLAIVVIATYSIATAFWIYTSESILYNIMDLCFGLYALVRILSV